MTEVSDTLRAARKLIEKPENWRPSWLAEDKNGNEVSITSPHACRWCIQGALFRVTTGVADSQPAVAALHAALPGSMTVGQFEYTHTHAEVMDLLDRTIAMQEREEAT